MMEILRDDNGREYYRAYVDTESNCLYTIWSGYINDKYVKTGSNAALELLKKHQCPYIINNNAAGKGPWQQSNEWIETVWMPQAIGLGLRYFAHVIAPNIFGQMSAQDLEKKAVGKFSMQLFEDEQQAKEWIKEMRAQEN